MRLHARRADGSDLLFIDQNTAGCPLHIPHFLDRTQRRECADTVILTVREHHGPVKSRIPGLSGRHDFQLRRDEILLADPVLVSENREDPALYGSAELLFLRTLFLLFPDGDPLAVRERLIVRFVLVILLCIIDNERLMANDQVQSLSLNDAGRLLLHELLRQVDQKV